MEQKQVKPGRDRPNIPRNSNVSPDKSKYEMMKSRRQQLNTILNDYSEAKGNNLTKNQSQNKFSRHNMIHHKSNSLIPLSSNKKINKKFLVSEYSEFMSRSGMNDNGPFREAVSPSIDRKNNVSDIEGATVFNKQLSDSKPIQTNYDKLETLENYKKSFLKRRSDAGNVNSKRVIRVDDIEGAKPKDRNSITKSKRMKITSAGLSDLLHDIDDYRSRMLLKNGQIDLHPRRKPETENRKQTFSVFDDTSSHPLNRTKDIETVQRVNNDPQKDKDKHTRSHKQFKSQPRSEVYPTNPSSIANNPIGSNIRNNGNDIEFSKQNSQRRDRLNKYISKVAGYNSNFNRQQANYTQISGNYRDDIKNLKASKYFGNPSPHRKVVRHQQKTIQDRDYRSNTAHKHHPVEAFHVIEKANNEQTRNPVMNISKSGVNKRLKLNIAQNLDRNLISKPSYMNPKVQFPHMSGYLPKLNPEYSGSISYNDLMLNHMHHKRRAEQEHLNKKSFASFA